MLIGRGTRRAIGIVLLISSAGLLGLTAFADAASYAWHHLGEARWPLLGMVALLLVSNIWRLSQTSQPPAPPAPKPRPTHLRLVKTDETIH